MSDRVVRIGGALGYWGDRHDALFDLLKGGPLDFVMMDYLAEVTMSILQKQRAKNPKMGYAHDFVGVVKAALPLLKKNKTRLIANAGGLNPRECAQALASAAREAGSPELKIGIVWGDDLLPGLEELRTKGAELRHFEDGRAMKEIPGTVVSANAYLGAFPIARALDEGADIVITGRVNDAALALGPLIHSFGWTASDFDLLAAGTIAGHLLECGGQASGGNFNGGWRDVPNLDKLGFPIAEVSKDGSFVMTIHPGAGGLVTPAVLKEQLLYEIGDPSAYAVADVTCDLTFIEMKTEGPNRVRVTGVKGRAPPADYKVSMSYEGGYKITVGLIYMWPDCVAKARAGCDLFLKRLSKLGLKYREHHVSILGDGAVHGSMSPRRPDPDEVYLRIAFLTDDEATAEKIAREMATHVVNGIPTACGLDGRASPQKQVAYWPSKISKSLVEAKTEVIGGAT